MVRPVCQSILLGTVLVCACCLPSCLLVPVNTLLRYMACIILYPDVRLTLQGLCHCLPDPRLMLQVVAVASVLAMYLIPWLWPSREMVSQLLKPPIGTVRRCCSGWQSLVEQTRNHLHSLIYQQGLYTWGEVQWLWYYSNSPGGYRPTRQPAATGNFLSRAVWHPSWKEVPKTVYRLNVRVHALIWRVTSYHVLLHLRIWLLVLEWFFCRFVSNNVLKSEGNHLNVLKKHKFKFLLYRQLPLRKISQWWGRMNQTDLPVWLRGPVYRLYIRVFNCKLDEAAITDLTHYTSVSKFFRRPLKSHLRPVDRAHCLTSPADGRILHSGPIQNGALEQIKGVTYSLSQFIGTDLNFLPVVKRTKTAKTNSSDRTLNIDQRSLPSYLHANIQLSCGKNIPCLKKFNILETIGNQYTNSSPCYNNMGGSEDPETSPNVYFSEDQPEFCDVQELSDGKQTIQVQSSYRKHPITFNDATKPHSDDEYQVEEHIFEQVFEIEEKDLSRLSLNQPTSSYEGFIQSLCPINRRLELEEELFASCLQINPGHVLHQCIIYLAPGDYHRFHSPADWTVYHRRHFPGNLFSVNPSIAGWLQGLFTMNERAMYTGRWQYGFFSMTAVGATNVGSINVFFDKKLRTNLDSTELEKCVYNETNFKSRNKDGVHLKRGELMGEFNLGSTIVLLFEAPPGFKLRHLPGKCVKYGQGMVEGVCNIKKYKHRKHHTWN